MRQRCLQDGERQKAHRRQSDKDDGRRSEAKHVVKQSLTSQIKDEMAEAEATGKTFVLRITDDTQLSKPLQDAMDALVKSGKGVIERVPRVKL